LIGLQTGSITSAMLNLNLLECHHQEQANQDI